MPTVFDLNRRFQNIDAEDVAYRAIDGSAKGYIEKQRAQMYEGINSDGEIRKPDYTPTTVSIKIRKGQRHDVVTLKDKGDFYQAMGIDIRADEFIVTSFDPKTGKLVNKYGEEIFGLSEKYKALYIVENLRPEFKSVIEFETGLKMSL